MATGTGHTTAEVDQRGRRMTLSQVVERLLERGGNQHSSVDLGLTASGKVTIAVSVRTSPDGEATTIDQAAAIAQELFDTLREKYEVPAAPTEPGA
jgi:hypothetical protein